LTTINGSVLNAIPQTRFAVASGLDVCEKLILHRGNPTNCVTTPIGSALCLDIVDQEVYMLLATGGSTWQHLISGA